MPEIDDGSLRSATTEQIVRISLRVGTAFNIAAQSRSVTMSFL
jgi:hypothetical protein